MEELAEAVKVAGVEEKKEEEEEEEVREVEVERSGHLQLKCFEVAEFGQVSLRQN